MKKILIVKKLLIVSLALILTLTAFPIQTMANMSFGEDEFSVSGIPLRGDEAPLFDVPVYSEGASNNGSRSTRLSGWRTINGKKYFYDNNGVPLKGWWSISSQIYYFDKNGVMQTGQTKVGKKVYYFTSNGHLKFGWVKIKGKRRFFSTNGTVGSALKVKNVRGNYKQGTVYGPGSSAKELKKVKSRVKKFLNKEVATNMTTYEKIKAAHDYLVKRCSYEHSTNWAVTKANTAYGALVKKKAQCSGYARAFKALCDAMKVKCHYVHATKSSSNPSHQWNIVKIGKNWYHIDVQNNDSSGFYANFLLSDKKVRTIWGLRWSSSLPKCKKDYVLKVNLK